MPAVDNCEILILEDEALIAITIERFLAAEGYGGISICSTVEEAFAQIAQCTPRIAILDINLGHGTTSVPVAERLSQLDVPFVFVSGYTDAMVALPEPLQGAGRITKPFRTADLIAKVQAILGNA